MDPLAHALSQARSRLALILAVRSLSQAALFSAAFACVWLVATRILPQLGSPLLPILVVGALALLTAVAYVLYRYPSVQQAAMELDTRLKLEERIVSSLALTTAKGDMAAALHRDARRAITARPVATAFPVQTPGAARWLWVPLLLFGVAYVALPEFDLFQYRARQAAALAKASRQEESAKTIEGAAKLLKKEDRQSEGTLADTVNKLELTAVGLRAGTLTDKQALAKVSDVLEGLNKQQQALAASKPAVAKTLQGVEHPELKKVLEDLRNGKPEDAADKLRELQERLNRGELSDDEKKRLEEGMKALSKALQRDPAAQKSDSAGEKGPNNKSANAKSGNKGDSKSDATAGESGDNMEMSMEDLASSLEQLGKMQKASAQLKQWKQSALGPSKFCRSCGKPLAPCNKPGSCKGDCPGGACAGACAAGECKGDGAGKGAWQAGLSDKQGQGMGKAGKGQGSQVGDLPDGADVDFQPTTLPGEQTQGKILTEITERTAPVADGETSKITVIQGDVQFVQQQAEEALNQEEIPAGAKEFVRQYFGSPEVTPDAQ
jgi:tetratricopeptide (TPR) repeat protein